MDINITTALRDVGIPVNQATVLLADTLDCSIADLHAHPERVLGDEEVVRWQDWLRRARGGEPSAYILNVREFYGLDFFVDRRVLIPRVETEQLVDLALAFLEQSQALSLRMLEVGTGSGAVLIALVKEFDRKYSASRRLECIATDLSLEALAVAEQNAVAHHVRDRVEFRQGDLFSPVQGECFDLILANLPYLPSQEVLANRYEPRLALDGGQSGRDLISRLLGQGSEHLRPGGQLIYEDYGGQVLIK